MSWEVYWQREIIVVEDCEFCAEFDNEEEANDFIKRLKADEVEDEYDHNSVSHYVNSSEGPIVEIEKREVIL